MLENNCIQCGKKLKSRQNKYCGRECNMKSFIIKKQIKNGWKVKDDKDKEEDYEQMNQADWRGF